MERQRDEAVGQMEREMRRMDRTKKEWALERQHLEVGWGCVHIDLPVNIHVHICLSIRCSFGRILMEDQV